MKRIPTVDGKLWSIRDFVYWPADGQNEINIPLQLRWQGVKWNNINIHSWKKGCYKEVSFRNEVPFWRLFISYLLVSQIPIGFDGFPASSHLIKIPHPRRQGSTTYEAILKTILNKARSWRAGPRLNIKTVLSTYGDFHVKDKTAVRTSYL